MHKYTIKQLFIYPIKGLSGLPLNSSAVSQKGLLYDRQWMIIDNENNRFISQRAYPEMALFKVTIEGQKVSIHFEGEVCTFNVSDYEPSEVIDASIWDDNVKVCEVAKDVSLWISQKLNIHCKLVVLAKNAVRNKVILAEPFDAPLNFPDGYPILILGTASLDELNRRCPDLISIDRFRANVIVETLTPHEEDLWKEVNTNNESSPLFKVIKPCVRCQVINIDQSTASTNLEPTKTLASYRRGHKGIEFGANTICLNEGNIQIGDELFFN